MSGQAAAVLAASDTGKGSPIGLFVVLLLIVAVYLLYRSMSSRLRRLPERFPGYGAAGTDAAGADPLTTAAVTGVDATGADDTGAGSEDSAGPHADTSAGSPLSPSDQAEPPSPRPDRPA